MTDMHVTILGCGSATPTLRHRPSGQALSLGRRLMLIDCGEGTQLQMRRYGLNLSLLTDIFISHMHGDHCLGLPGLLSTLSLQDKRSHLTVHLPADGMDIVGRMVDYFCGNMAYDIELEALPTGEGTLLDTKSLTVETFKLKHGVPAHGFLFKAKAQGLPLRGDMLEYHGVPVYARAAIKEGADFVKPDGTVVPNAALTLPAREPASYAYCSDTSYYPGIIPHIEGTKVLYHESTYLSDLGALARERGHSTAAEAATIARDAHVGQLVIGHYSKRYRDTDALLAEAQAIFPDTIAADEGLEIKI